MSNTSNTVLSKTRASLVVLYIYPRHACFPLDEAQLTVDTMRVKNAETLALRGFLSDRSSLPQNAQSLLYKQGLQYRLGHARL